MLMMMMTMMMSPPSRPAGGAACAVGLLVLLDSVPVPLSAGTVGKEMQ